MTIQYKDTTQAIRKRIARLPEFVREMADTTTKKDAVGVVDTFQDGIRNGTFNLIRLAASTIRKKSKEGFSRPTKPLYGAGDNKKNSLINVLRIRKIKNGWRVFQSGARHWRSMLPLNFLLLIHENGATIDLETHIVRIPPRPVREKAFKRYLRRKAREENVQQVRDAINLYIRTGDKSAINRYNRSVKKSKAEE